MLTKRISVHILLFALFLLFFYMMSENFSFFHEHIFFSFSITLLLYILSSEFLLSKAQRFLFKNFHFRESEALDILEHLNVELNRARNFDQVLQKLSQGFNTLFDEDSYCFFVLQDEKFKPVLSGNIAQELAPRALLDCSIFNSLEQDQLYIHINALPGIPEQTRQQFRKLDLEHIFVFQGHEGIFAFLILSRDLFSKQPYSKTQMMFEKIQKKAGLILENKSLLLNLHKKHSETRKLIEISHRILSAFDTKQVLDFILDSLKGIIAFDAAAIFLVDKSGKRLLNTSCTGYEDESVTKLHLKVGQGSCGWVVQSGVIDVIDDVRNSKHYFNLRSKTRSQLSLPLVFDQTVLGVLCLESNRLSFFTESMVDQLQLFAHLAALAIHNARQLNVLLAKRALEHELINAGTVQKHLLVRRFPMIKHLKTTAVNIPSIIVSGDLYDIIKFDETIAGIAIGDVSGKGAAAALMMSLILAGLRSHTKTFRTACDVVFHLNNLLYESTTDGNYASFFYAILSTAENKLIYTNAGHNPPLFIKANGEIVRLEEGGLVLGFRQNWEYKQQEIEFEPGDLLLAYTDGVTEILDHDEQEFGEERLMKLAAQHHRASVFEIKEKVLEAINRFSGEESNRDDVTLVVCKYETGAE